MKSSYPIFLGKGLFLSIVSQMVLCCLSFSVKGQSDTINYVLELPDTIQLELAHLNRANEQVNYLLDVIENLPVEHNKLILTLSQTCYELAERNNLKLASAKAEYWRITSIYEDLIYTEGISVEPTRLEGLLYAFKQAKLPLWEARVKIMLSNIYTLPSIGKDSIALATNNELLEQLKKLNPNEFHLLFGNYYKSRGNIFFHKQDWQSATAAYQKAHSYYALDSIRLKGKLVDINMNLAIVNLPIREYEKAIIHSSEAFSFCEANDSVLLARIHLDYAHILTEIAIEKGQIDSFRQSNEHLQQAILYGNPQLSRCYYQLGANTQNIAIFTDEIDGEEYDKLLNKAASYYQKSISCGIEEGNTEVYKEVFDATVKLFEDGKIEAAKIIMPSIKDAYIFTYEQVDSLNQQKLDLDKRLDEEKEAKSKVETSRKIALIILTALLLLGLVSTLYLWNRNKIITQNFEIRLEALRSQINSHFISNTLNAIDSLIMEGEKNEASRYIVALHRLVRKTLESSKEHLISLEREVEILRDYLSLEQLRVGERVHIEWNIDEGLELKNYKVPPLILQPFVENAIWHGVLNKENNESGTVRISIQLKADKLVCSIQDDGVGRTRTRELQAETELEFQSLATPITNERIEKIVKDASVEIIDLYQEDGKSAGTKVVIQLPKHIN